MLLNLLFSYFQFFVLNRRHDYVQGIFINKIEILIKKFRFSKDIILNKI